jgi:hypothetical protein
MAMSLYQKIVAHRGHEIEVAVYGLEDDPVNAAVECLDCFEVIVDEDRDIHMGELDCE